MATTDVAFTTSSKRKVGPSCQMSGALARWHGGVPTYATTEMLDGEFVDPDPLGDACT